MVAIAGTGWVLAPSLVAYVHEADHYYPQRDRTSDGSVGDLAHQARVSDHNPVDGYVHAVDLDEDLAPGLDLRWFAEKLRSRRDPRIKYVIYEGRIFKSYISTAGPAWQWLPYTGVNAHEHHLHLSILSTDAARTSTAAWGFAPNAAPPKEPDDMTPEQERLLRRVHDALGLGGKDDDYPAKQNISGRVGALYLDMKLGTAGEDVDVGELAAAINALPGKTVAALKAAL